MNAGPHPLFGQCACGAALTAWHLQNACPLRPQRDAHEALLVIGALARSIYDTRLDTSHAAELGYN